MTCRASAFCFAPEQLYEPRNSSVRMKDMEEPGDEVEGPPRWTGSVGAPSGSRSARVKLLVPSPIC
jgi:hypothetical protein